VRGFAGASRCGPLGGVTSAATAVRAIMRRGNGVTACAEPSKK